MLTNSVADSAPLSVKSTFEAVETSERAMQAVLSWMLSLCVAAWLVLASLSGAQAVSRQIVVEPTSAMPGTRVALVVGIDHYAHGGAISAPDLDNPIHDALAMRDMLTGLGFAVVYGEDLSKADFDNALDTFEDRAQKADVALVYFSGHGASFDDLPYLVPSDATFFDIRKTVRQLVKVEDVLARLRSAKGGVRIALFDACRDNVAEQELKQRSAGTKGVSQARGLARVQGADGMIVMYAAQHLQTAEDGSDGHSPFAQALLDQLPTPNTDILVSLNDVARKVISLTNQKQRPELVVDLFEKFALVEVASGGTVGTGAERPAPPNSPTPPSDTRLSEAALIWPALKDTTSVEALTDFKTRMAGTTYEILAEQRLQVLRKLAMIVTPSDRISPDSSKTGTFGVLLASRTSDIDARATWQDLQKRSPTVLSGLTPNFVKLSIDNRVYIRIVIGSWESKNSANEFCSRLKLMGTDCVVVRNLGRSQVDTL